MIGTELLQLLQGDPLAQMRSQIAGPNPNPQAPPPAAAQLPNMNQPAQRAPGATLLYAARRCPAWSSCRLRKWRGGNAAPQGPRQRPAALRSLHRPCRSLDPRPRPPKARLTWLHCTCG